MEYWVKHFKQIKDLFFRDYLQRGVPLRKIPVRGPGRISCYLFFNLTIVTFYVMICPIVYFSKIAIKSNDARKFCCIPDENFFLLG